MWGTGDRCLVSQLLTPDVPDDPNRERSSFSERGFLAARKDAKDFGGGRAAPMPAFIGAASAFLAPVPGTGDSASYAILEIRLSP